MCDAPPQKYRLYLKRVSGVHPSMGARGKGGKGGGGSDAAFQALMGLHGGHPMAANMAAVAAMGGMLPGGVPGRDFMHPMQLQQVRRGPHSHPSVSPKVLLGAVPDAWLRRLVFLAPGASLPAASPSVHLKAAAPAAVLCCWRATGYLAMTGHCGC